MHIKQSTFDFLSDLKANNDRNWFADNRERYDQALENVTEFVEAIIGRLSDLDPHIHTGISAKKCLFRIYRDIRFSKNKLPYKHWFAAGISVDGRKLAGPEYYLHLEPGKSWVASGYWRPAKEHLEAIRQEIDYNPEELLASLKKGSWSLDALSDEERLKRPPMGYSSDHEYIELLKNRSFILQQAISDTELFTAGLDRVIQAWERMLPFKLYLHQALDQ